MSTRLARREASEIEISLELAEPCEDVVAEFRHDAGHGGGAQPYKICTCG